MIKTQADAAQGGKDSTLVFQTLGIAIKDSAGNLRGTAEVFGDFAQVFSELKDGPEKTSLALRVFGKAGAELIPLLNEGKAGIAGYAAELEKLGGVVTPEAAARADAFNDNLDKLKVAFGGVALQVADNLLPDLIALTDKFASAATEGDGVKGVADDIADSLRILAKAANLVIIPMQAIVDLVQATVSGFIGYALAAKGAAQALTGDFAGAAKSYKDSLEEMRQADIAFNETRENFADDPVRKAGPQALTAAQNGPSHRKRRLDLDPLFTPEAKKSTATKAKVDEVAQAYERMNAQMQETIDLYGVTDMVALKRYEIEHSELAKLSGEQKQHLLDMAAINQQQIADTKLLDARNKKEQEAADLAERHKEDVAALLDDIAFETKLLAASNEERAKMVALRYADAEAAGVDRDAIIAAMDAYHREAEETGKLKSAMDEFRAGFEDNVADVLTGAQSIGDAFKNMADLVVQMIARMIAQNLAANLFGAPGSTGAGSPGGDIAAAVFKAFIPGFASGTDYAPGGMAMVGESGPELVNLPRGSQVIPNHRLGSVGGATVIQNIRVAENTSRQTASQLAYKSGHAAQVALSRNS